MHTTDLPRTSWISDAWLATTGPTFERSNPARLSERQGPYFAARPEDVDTAIRAAAIAQPSWSAAGAAARAKVLNAAAAAVRARADEIAAMITAETGKPSGEARGEANGAAMILEFLAGAAGWGWDGRFGETLQPGRLGYTRRAPVGVVGLLTPWNFPLSNPCIKIGASLMAGNAVVWKPASWSPMTAIALTRCLVEAGLPSGVLSTVLGSGDRVGRQLADDARVAAISFTGSTEVGRGLAAGLAARGARLQSEMGGKNAALVLEDADLESAADQIAKAAFLFAGQKCTATSRVIVMPGIRKAFVEALVEATRRLAVADPRSPEAVVGPVIHERPLETHLAAIHKATKAGARVVEGGSRLGGELAGGNFLGLTILDNVDPQSSLAQVELFGPILGVIDTADYRGALDIVNSSNYGLTAAIYTRDLARAIDFAERAEVGVVKVNEPTTGLDPHLPTGGWKDSGMGLRELGSGALDFYSEEKTVYLNPLEVRSL
jgi:acyl-CoA reductase-like NAD-dependent aldehyde dehydrogenase